jgi:hypothetical protein
VVPGCAGHQHQRTGNGGKLQGLQIPYSSSDVRAHMRGDKVLFWATSASELKLAASDTSSSHTSPRYLQSRGVRHRSHRYRHRGNRLRSHVLLRFSITARSYRMRSDRCSSSGTGIPHYLDPKLPSMQGECISRWVELCVGLTQVPFVNPIGDLRRDVQEPWRI